MNFDEYQSASAITAIYPKQGTVLGLTYTALGLCGEAGELAENVKKALRDDQGVITNERRDNLVKELGDVMWYAAQIANELSYPLAKVAQANLDKLSSRRERGVLQGSGDHR